MVTSTPGLALKNIRSSMDDTTTDSVKRALSPVDETKLQKVRNVKMYFNIQNGDVLNVLV